MFLGKKVETEIIQDDENSQRKLPGVNEWTLLQDVAEDEHFRAEIFDLLGSFSEQTGALFG